MTLWRVLDSATAAQEVLILKLVRPYSESGVLSTPGPAR